MSALSKAVDELVKVSGDFSSLDVQTYTGKISAVSRDDKGKIQWPELSKGAFDEANVELTILLASSFKVDGDAEIFIAETGVTEQAQMAHDAAVKSGVALRSEILSFFKSKIV
ncbi:hypothetical protein [Sessilibacter corallicola]|uniref:hypothetical protein n=1 Tax=Sessilibacter corallicola TaxID=2904075 RepID=UPI001E481905|nr:hypothetical protein [Sessilibacter corallicola]MCE2027500.1 hypothetical protein [Sessilibacter corallicola]